MLNLIMTHSPRLAAITNHKRLGEETDTNHALRHRLAWLQEKRKVTNSNHIAIEPALRERTA